MCAAHILNEIYSIIIWPPLSEIVFISRILCACVYVCFSFHSPCWWCRACCSARSTNMKSHPINFSIHFLSLSGNDNKNDFIPFECIPLSSCPRIRMSLSLYLSICLSIYPSIHLSIYLPIHLSISPLLYILRSIWSLIQSGACHPNTSDNCIWQ